MWYFQILGTDIFLHRYFNDAGQPTTHFNVLNEAGLDKRRVIVDEKAPLFYVGLTNVYPPMQFLLAKQDFKHSFGKSVLGDEIVKFIMRVSKNSEESCRR